MFQLVYELLDWFLQIVVDIFFREVSIRGSFNFPSSGPTIVVIAPHANQYLDAAISVLSAKVVSNRQVFMIEAASSYRNSWMSLWSKWSGAIPVERPQDLLAPKDGIIRFANYPTDQLTIVGENTHFLRDCGPKGLIGLPNKAGNVKIAQIVSDTKLVLASKMKKQAGIELLLKGTTYMFAPRIDNSQLFEKVFDALKEGTCIGIAPEGGSHDRPELLEFKPGVALMALGAVAKYSDINVTIVPCGLNYFHPHKFRSRAVVEYGTPIVVGQERVQSYKNDSRKAVSDLMAEITAAMNLVTTQAPDYETLQVIQAVRRLYSYGRFHRPPLPVVVEMNRNLLIGYKEFKDDPKVIHLRDSVLDYNHKLRTFGLKDHQLEDASLNKLQTFQLLIKRVCLLLFYGVLSLPGTILFSPIFITCSVMSKKKQKIALSKSVVKINATDVLASWKVLIALFFAPVCYFIYSVTSVLLIIHYELLPDTTRSFSGKILIFCVSWAVLVCTTYSAFKMGEVGMDIYKSILPLVLFLSPFSQQLVKLKEERKNLSIEVTELINELGPKVFKKFNETFIDDLKEQVEQEEEEIRSNSRSRSTSRSRSASRSRSSSKLRLIQNSGSLHNPTPSLSRTSSNYSGFSNFDGSDDHGKLPDFSHVSIFSDQLQMPDSETSATSSFENISSFNEALSTGVETGSLTEKIRKAVIQRNLESESQEK